MVIVDMWDENAEENLKIIHKLQKFGEFSDEQIQELYNSKLKKIVKAKGEVVDLNNEDWPF